MNDLVKIQALLEAKADCQARLNLLPYDGSPEIKEQNGFVIFKWLSTPQQAMEFSPLNYNNILVDFVSDYPQIGSDC